jgi:hypothetical protein
MSWRKEFPFLKSVDLDEVSGVPKGFNFLCDAYGQTRGRFYFFAIEFSPKRRGQFSLRVAVSSSPEHSKLGSVLTSKPAAGAIGSFGIARFLGKNQFAWALVDLEAERDALFKDLGVPMPDLGDNRSNRIWRPSTYEQTFEAIAAEAIAHLNDMIRTKVFPVLEIDLVKLSGSA